MAQKKPQQSFQYSDEEYFQKADNLIHSSCPVLRSLFRKRWKHATGSEWSEASAREFISGVGKDAYYKVRPIQKKLIELGKLEEWDISLLGFLLKKINGRRGSGRDKWKEETKAVEQLVQLRNNAAHMPTKKLTGEAYAKIEGSVRAQLAVLGVTPEEIEVMIENAGVLTPVSGWSAAMQMLEKGEEQFRKKKYREAIKLYGDALHIPNLLQQNQAILFEKRAEAHLALAECINTDSERKKSLEESLKDVKQSLEYQNASWKAHQIIGRIYRHQNNLELAVEHLNRSLSISPGQKEVKAELDCCKLRLGKMLRSEHLDPIGQPMTFDERIKHFTDETGKPMTKKMWQEMGASMDELIPGKSHVETGHRYNAGWDVKQDYLEASRHYTKAEKLGNADGTFNLALLYMYGNGVQQSVPYAIELLKKAANMPPEIRLGGKWGQNITNVGVAEAQHSLALKYADGIGVAQDYAEAAKWYEKAANNGEGKAANNLACLYFDGQGVVQDVEKAVRYWKLGVLKKDMNAACSLYEYYQREVEPELARKMFTKSLELGNDHLKMVQKEVWDQLRKMEKERAEIEPDVVEFEKKNGLDGNGLTFHQRMLRRMRGFGAGAILANICGDTMEPVQEALTSLKRGPRNGSDFEYDFDELKQKAAERPTTVQGSSSVFALPSNPPRNSRPHLQDPWRLIRIKEHRSSLNDMKKKMSLPFHQDVRTTQPPRLQHKLPRSLTDLKSIKMNEIDATKDSIYEGRILNLTIIEDPTVGIFTAVGNLAEDENGDVVRIHVYNVPHNETTAEQLGFGSTLSVINPYLRIGSNDLIPFIRVDDPKCIIYNEGVKDMCRYCGEENARFNCSKCKRAKYCSRECQEKDWKTLKHKLICVL